jgi:hypothetical protein
LFPGTEELSLMLERRPPAMDPEVRDLLTKLATEINASFTAGDSRTRVETPMSLRAVLDRYPAGLRMYADAEDPMRSAWQEFVLPHIDPYDRDHYETVWSAVVRVGPNRRPFSD